MEKSKIKILQYYICYLSLADVRKPDMTVMGDTLFCATLLPGVNCLLWRTIFAVSIKISKLIKQFHLLRIYSAEIFSHTWKDLCTKLFIAVLFVIGNKMWTTSVISIGSWFNWLWHIHTVKYSQSYKNDEQK